MPDVALFVRSSGENRPSTFLLWQSAYAEFVFLDTLWPDFDRRQLWAACEEYASRQRRVGGGRAGRAPAPPAARAPPSPGPPSGGAPGGGGRAPKTPGGGSAPGGPG